MEKEKKRAGYKHGRSLNLDLLKKAHWPKYRKMLSLIVSLDCNLETKEYLILIITKNEK